MHEVAMLVFGTETHHPLDTRTVVPRPIEQHDFAGGGQVFDVALKVPLAPFDFTRFLQRDHSRPPRIQVLHESFD